MFNSAVLEVAIGLMFLYLVFSLVCSSAAEAIEVFARRRAADLAHGISQLLGDPARQGLFLEFYQHPLIGALKREKKHLPSYIASRTFAMTLLDILSRQAMPTGSQPSNAQEALSSLQRSGEFVQAQKVQETLASNAAAIRQPKKIFAALPESNLKRALLSVVAHADESLEGTVQAMESWYNAAMDGVSAWYKRRTHRMIAFLGLLLACSLNLDTMAIVSGLYSDANLRSALVVKAEDFVHQPSPSPSMDANAQFQKNVQAFRSLGLPVGWKPDSTSRGGHVYGWASKILGLLLTTLAISLGAPFWFDVLNRFIIVRSTVKPREKSREEPSKG